MGVSSPASATICFACALIGANGFSGISAPAITGVHSSSNEVRLRMMRDFACPRSPSRIMSCPERIAFSI